MDLWVIVTFNYDYWNDMHLFGFDLQRKNLSHCGSDENAVNLCKQKKVYFTMCIWKPTFDQNMEWRDGLKLPQTSIK